MLLLLWHVYYVNIIIYIRNDFFISIVQKYEEIY